MASLECSALVKGTAHSARPTLGTTCLKANVSKMPNNSFQRTLTPAAFGPLNSNR